MILKYCLYCTRALPEGASLRRLYCDSWCRLQMFRLQRKLPTLAHGEHYQFWKSLHNYTPDELQVLFKKRRESCKHTSRREEIMTLRKEMKLIGMVYRELKKL